MFIEQKPHLRALSRVRVSEGRNLKDGLRLDRNEKVDVWPADFLQKVFADKLPCFLSVYPESSTLYRKLAAFLGVEEDELMLSSGIDGILKTIFEVMTAPGDLVGVASPTYAMYKVYSAMFQARLFEIGYRPDFSLDLDQFEECLRGKPKVIFLPNPNQPIESAFSLSELEGMAQKTLAAGCLFVIDEAYHMFGCPTGLPLVRKYENVVVTRTFSKGFGTPSIRLGFMVSGTDNMKVLAKTRFAHESNALSNAVAEYLLDHYAMVEDYVREVVAGREHVKSELARMGLRCHGNTGNYLLIDLGSQAAAARIVAGLRERLIYVKGPWQAPWDRYITVTVGPVRLMDRFLEALGACLDSERQPSAGGGRP